MIHGVYCVGTQPTKRVQPDARLIKVVTFGNTDIFVTDIATNAMEAMSQQVNLLFFTISNIARSKLLDLLSVLVGLRCY